MSFLKQNWFYIPAAIALACVVLLGILKLYSTINPIEPNTVSLAPQPSTEEPQHFTDGPATTTAVSTHDSQSTESTPQETPEEHVHTHTESHHHPAITHSDDQTTDQTSTVARYTEGPYKGMTYEQAQKYYEWRTHYNELQQRLIEHSKKERAHARAMIKSADDELSVVLSVFALLSPEQLEIARQEALKTVPADQVEKFFEDLANHSTTRTPDQITKDAKAIIESRQVRDIVFEQLGVEFEQIKKELRESERNKP